MLAIIYSLLPIFSLIMMGFVFRKWKFPSDNFWVSADRLTYFVLLPALIIQKLAVADFSSSSVSQLYLVLCGSVVVMGMLALALGSIFRIRASSLTSVFQGSIRPNTYVVLASATALYGSEGLALAVIPLAGVIPLVNILCILSFAYYVPNGKRTLGGVLKSIFQNPLVIACIIGICLNLTGIGLPFFTYDLFDILASAALPLGLISVGTGLRALEQRQTLIPIIIANICKLVLMPICAFLLLQYMGLDGLSLAVGTLFCTVPCAISSYILAGHLNGDQPLMASIITIETLVAFVTMPVLLAILLG
ncbi:MAG: AEC family transporter [Cytophagales bacterium]|nr:AEC family transporter [Cytophagales bacterium]